MICICKYLDKIKNSLTISVVLSSILTTQVLAKEGFNKDDANLYNSKKFALGTGFVIVRFDTNVKVTDKASGDTSYIGVEQEKVVWIEIKDGKEYRYTTDPGTSGWRRFNEGVYSILRSSLSYKISC